MPDSVAQFPAFLAEVWQHGVFGVSFTDITIAIAVVFAFYMLRGLAGRFFFTILKRTATRLDDALYATLIPPVRLLFVAAGFYFAFNVLPLQGEAEAAADNFLRSLIVYVVFWFLYNSVELLTAALSRLERAVSPEIMSWGVRTLRWGIVILGGAAILEVWGVRIAPLIAGLGLFGLAVALAAQDLFKNFLGGLSILLERRFQKGDWIKVDNVVEGTVEHVGFRSSKIIRFDRAPVVVPNSVFSDNAVINFSQIPLRRIYWLIGLEYRTSVPRLRRIRDQIENHIRQDSAFARPPDASLFVRVDSFSDSAITLMLYCFTKTTDWGEWLKIKESLALAIKEIVEGEGANFAFPSRSLYIESIPVAQTPEVFAPPVKRGEKK